MSFRISPKRRVPGPSGNIGLAGNTGVAGTPRNTVSRHMKQMANMYYDGSKVQSIDECKTAFMEGFITCMDLRMGVGFLEWYKKLDPDAQTLNPVTLWDKFKQDIPFIEESGDPCNADEEI